MIISGTYNLTRETLFSDNINYPNLETEFLCNTTLGAVTFNLLPISELNGFWGLLIVLSDYTGNSATNNITVNATGGNTINGVTGSTLTINSNGNSIVLQPISDNQWIAFSNGGSGGSSDKNYVYTQVVPATTWTVNHNLNKRCAVQVIDNTFNEVEAQILWNDNNTVTITTNSPATGFVYCN